MNSESEFDRPISTRDWYDFVGLLSDVLPGMHLGGEDATHDLLALCQLDRHTRVLDVGCGSGATACRIASRYGSSVRGIDLSEVMIAKAEERAQGLGLYDRVDFRTGDVFELPYGDGEFDVIIMESVLVPLPGDVQDAMGEMVRVLRPGGRLCANESTVDPEIPDDLRESFAEHPATYRTFTPQTLRELFEEAGLEVVHLSEVSSVGAPSALQGIGLGGILSFMLRTYPKILSRILRDPNIRRASQIDDQVTKAGKPYMGYTLIVGQKPSR
jgi:ubiquinone/menaquinone biosynthesis C-methylase UbiE